MRIMPRLSPEIKYWAEELSQVAGQRRWNDVSILPWKRPRHGGDRQA